ncbi:hypothetical protein [Oceanobacillus kapialis]|uniref:Two component regulator three Y domain-containing protein n=1 Tax=Oceanobacillus kapialis TaxID=481353 RepID=A0ABW5PXC4_9BACI
MFLDNEECPTCFENTLSVHENDISGEQEKYCGNCGYRLLYNTKTNVEVSLDNIVGSGYPGEKEYTKSKRKLHYLFQKAENNNKDLIVIFSAFPKKGQPPVYNYIRKLLPVDSNKLFILDEYGPSASYYLGGNRDFSLEDSVISLIKDVCLENAINFANVTSMGSSKGGFASLYFGIKYGFGNIVAAAPQIYMGNFVFGVHPNVAEYISGGLTESDKEYLNDLLPKVLKKSSHKPKIHLHVGKGDHHYKGHILPFIKLLDDKNINYDLDLQDYQAHDEVGAYFPDYLYSVFKDKLKTVNV